MEMGLAPSSLMEYASSTCGFGLLSNFKESLSIYWDDSLQGFFLWEYFL